MTDDEFFAAVHALVVSFADDALDQPKWVLVLERQTLAGRKRDIFDNQADLEGSCCLLEDAVDNLMELSDDDKETFNS